MLVIVYSELVLATELIVIGAEPLFISWKYCVLLAVDTV